MTIEEIIERLEGIYKHCVYMSDNHTNIDWCKDAIVLDYAIMVVKRDLIARQPNKSQN